MAVGDIIVGIDVGYSKVSLLMGKVDNFNQIQEIVKVSKPCKSYENNKLNTNLLIPVLDEILVEAEEESGIKIGSAYVNVPGEYTSIIHKEIKRFTKDKTVGISTEDVVNTIIDASNTEIPRDKVVIDIAPDGFLLDNNVRVKDPVNKKSETLTLLTQIIVADKEYVTRAQRIFNEVGLEVDAFVPNALINRQFYLEGPEFNENLMILNVGARSTEISVFFGNSFIYSDTYKMGGDTITSDLESIFQISYDEAELIKRKYPLALRSYIENDNNIRLSTSKIEKLDTIKISNVVEIIEGRIEDIYLNINKDLKNTGLKEYINGIILCGDGISSIYKSDVVCTVAFNLPVKFATSKNLLLVKPTKFHDAYSIVKYIASKPYLKTVSSKVGEDKEESFMTKVINKIKDFFYS